MFKKLMWLAMSLAFCATLAHGQATVNETLETATIYVDAVNGSDSNPGTLGAPLQTITKALTVANTNNHMNIGTKIMVNPGTYRESIEEIATAKTTSMPITLEAVSAGTAILSGSDLYTNWSQYSGNASFYTIPWTANYGFCVADTQAGAPYQAPIVLRREMVFINGQPMTQVLDLAQMVYAGTFYVDDAHQTMYVWPPAGVEINSASVEIGLRDPEITITDYSGFVLRGMTVEHANSCHNNTAMLVTVSATNILLDNDIFQWNNAKGLNFRTVNTLQPVQNITVQNSQFLHNGESGATDFRLLNSLWTNDTFNYNNWRGAMGSYYSWDASGMYFTQEHNQTASNLTALYNMGNGFHWDTDSVGDTATGIISESNLINGIFFEKNQGPVTLTDATVAGNLPSPNITQGEGGGILFRNSENITLESSKVFGNGGAQLTVVGQAGGLAISNWQTGVNYALVSSDLTFNQNVIEATAATANVFANAWLNGTDWTKFIAAPYTSTNNTWWNTQGNVNSFIVPSPTQNTAVNFTGWQSATMQDLTGSNYGEPVPDPAESYVATPPDAPDYWLVVDHSTQSAGADGTATYTLYSVPLGTFSGTINLALVGVSDTAGLSGTISATSINQTGNTVVTLAAAKTVPEGTYQATVVANSGELTHAVTFSIIVSTTFVRVTPGTLAFPPTQSGSSSSVLQATLTNYGTTTLAISGVTTSTQWSETNTCNGSVAAGASCIFSVTFTPNGASNLIGTMSIADSDPASPQIVNLTGTGTASPLVTVTPPWLIYGTVPIGTSTESTATLTNTGQGTLEISSMTVTGTNASEFTQSNTCGNTVEAGASCEISVTFMPAGVGVRTATVTINDNAPNQAQTVGLSGIGSEAIATLTPSSATYGNQVAGTTSAAKTFTLKNSGGAPLNISSISITGSGAADFTETNTCGNSVAAYGQCTISASFAPQAAGIDAATLAVMDNSTGSSQSATLSGTGISAAVSVTPSSLIFAAQNVGTRSTGLKVTVTNLSSSIVTMGSIAITGINAGDFTDGDGCGPALGVNKSCTVTVYFDPAAAGARAASLNIAMTVPAGTQSVNLTGTGTQAAATLSTTTLNFGTVKDLTTSAPMNVTLTNTGTGALTITLININGTNSAWFAETNTCGSSVAAGASCTISVTATPKGKATGTATLNVHDNAPMTPQTAALTVTGD
jgi:hypothetical protein